MRTNGVPFAVYGVPLMGLIGLVACLWHPPTNLQAAAVGPETVYLVSASPKLDPSMTVFLRQEAKDVTYSRRHDSRAVQAQVIANYNLIAQECTPAVFQTTHLPSAIAF